MEEKNLIQNAVDDSDIAIKIIDVKKRYRLGVITAGTLQADIKSWWARIRGKEDPTLKIGQKKHDKNEIFYALDGINLTVKKGERVGIIGHNGAGKSTLLKLLSRVTAPTEGQICLDGRISSMLEVGTGFNGELTGRENTYLNGAILGMSKKEVDAKMDKIIEFSEVGQFIDTPVKRYSSGMFVKLAFSVAAHLDNEIMIMDEVLAVGDMAFQKKCLEKMSEVSKNEGKTILYVSHNMNTIRQLCDRCVVLDHGKVIFDGAVDEGIGIYLKNGREGAAALDADLTQLEHIGTEPKIATLTRFAFCNKEYPIYRLGETIDAKVWINVEKSVDNLCFRAIVISFDGATVSMLTTLAGDIDGGVGEKVLPIHMDISSLIPGKYYLKLVAYDVNEIGNNVNLDIVENAVSFSIEESRSENKLEWNPKWWGYLRLPPIKVDKSINDKNEQ